MPSSVRHLAAACLSSLAFAAPPAPAAGLSTVSAHTVAAAAALAASSLRDGPAQPRKQQTIAAASAAADVTTGAPR